MPPAQGQLGRFKSAIEAHLTAVGKFNDACKTMGPECLSEMSGIVQGWTNFIDMFCCVGGKAPPADVRSPLPPPKPPQPSRCQHPKRKGVSSAQRPVSSRKRNKKKATPSGGAKQNNATADGVKGPCTCVLCPKCRVPSKPCGGCIAVGHWRGGKAVVHGGIAENMKENAAPGAATPTTSVPTDRANGIRHETTSSGPFPVTAIPRRDLQTCEKCEDCYHKACLPVNERRSDTRLLNTQVWFCTARGCASHMERAAASWRAHLARKQVTSVFNESVEVPPPVKALYRVLKKTSTLSGSGAGGAMFGEITQGSMQKIVHYLQQYCDMSERSSFVDLGSGLGKPSMHVAATPPGVRASFGVEYLQHCWALSVVNLTNAISQGKLGGNVCFVHRNVCELASLMPFTHVYAFDRGWSTRDMHQLSSVFNRSQSTVRFYVSYHSPRDIIFEFGFDVEHVGKVSVSMSGSSQSHTAHVYRSLRGRPLTPVPPLLRQSSEKPSQRPVAGVSEAQQLVGSAPAAPGMKAGGVVAAKPELLDALGKIQEPIAPPLPGVGDADGADGAAAAPVGHTGPRTTVAGLATAGDQSNRSSSSISSSNSCGLADNSTTKASSCEPIVDHPGPSPIASSSSSTAATVDSSVQQGLDAMEAGTDYFVAFMSQALENLEGGLNAGQQMSSSAGARRSRRSGRSK